MHAVMLECACIPDTVRVGVIEYKYLAYMLFSRSFSNGTFLWTCDEKCISWPPVPSRAMAIRQMSSLMRRAMASEVHAARKPLPAVMCPVHRKLCVSANAYDVLGLPHGAERSAIRRRFYELAKQTHPDSQALSGDDGPSVEYDGGAFVRIQAAYETLLKADSSRKSDEPKTAAAHAARGTAKWARQSRAEARPSSGSVRQRTLGEVLCERLKAEPEAVDIVWQDVRGRNLEVTGKMADLLFRACALHHGQENAGSGMSQALQILREATPNMTSSTRAQALVSLLCWCKEDELDCTFEVCNEINDADRTPEVLAALSASFSYFPSGASF
eukprot:6212549-Pleurochrysis_carterae.AAC.6